MLLIIDMQPKFRAYKKALPGVIQEIKAATMNNEHIVLLEYSNWAGGEYVTDTPTVVNVMRLVRKYPKLAVVIKNRDAGGHRAIKKAPQAFPRGEEIKVCGVNTEACVRATVEQLAKRGKKVRVITDACATHKQRWHVWGLDVMRKMQNVRVV